MLDWPTREPESSSCTASLSLVVRRGSSDTIHLSLVARSLTWSGQLSSSSTLRRSTSPPRRPSPARASASASRHRSRPRATCSSLACQDSVRLFRWSSHLHRQLTTSTRSPGRTAPALRRPPPLDTPTFDLGCSALFPPRPQQAHPQARAARHLVRPARPALPSSGPLAHPSSPALAGSTAVLAAPRSTAPSSSSARSRSTRTPRR